MDYFFLKIFRILIFLKKDEGGAKWGAFLYMSAYTAAIMIFTTCLIGFLFDNTISQLMKSYPKVFWMSTFIVSPVLLSLRYYRYTSVAAIEASYNAMNNSKCRLVVVLVYATMIAVPVLTFIFFRLYMVGHL